MASDDYFVVVYKILHYLYECIKAGQDIDIHNILTAEMYAIKDSYFEYILAELQEVGYIDGINIISMIGTIRRRVKVTHRIKIKPKGIEYLQENSMMKKAKDIAKGIKDIVPRFIE